MSYKFKGTDISTITNTTGGVNTIATNYYTGFPATVATNYNMMKPLSLGYTTTVNSIDVSNSCTAAYTDYNNTQTINTIPTGAKKFRYILVGGGGGGGGAGGDANSNSYYGDSDATGNGGDGGAGDYSTYLCGIIDIVNNSLDITIGTGGNVGINGANKSTKGGISSSNDTKVGNGNNGNNGNQTYFVYNSEKTTSNVGTGGKLGNGGYAWASSRTTNSNSGNTSENTNTIVNYANAMDANTPPLGDSYGKGGSGAINNPAQIGNAGTGGICRIIWLYD
jgi:hypothetical protein